MTTTEYTDAFGAIRAGILSNCVTQRRYALALVDDLDEAEMIAQPVSGVVMNHPAWILSHLSVYLPVVMSMLDGGVPDDPIDHKFGRKSAPLDDPKAYLPKERLVEKYIELHEGAEEAFRYAEREVLASRTPIPRFVERFPTVAHVVIHLMIKHEATHLGQLSAWRRAGGRPMVSM
ncbi:MAG: DinB family protein [Phycisphaeraceae bacterium]|nr:DinB family protein [Phycisphaeraceae bacterium]